MAIFHAHHVLLLLATLFFLPALDGAVIDFKYCGEFGNEFCNITRMEISQDPSAPEYAPTGTLNVYAYARKNIPAGTVIDLCTQTYANASSTIQTYNICDVVRCNLDGDIETGDNFVLTFSHLYPAAGYLDFEYVLSMTRTSYYQQLVCVIFKVSTFDPALVSA